MSESANESQSLSQSQSESADRPLPPEPRLLKAARAVLRILLLVGERGTARFALFASYALVVTWPLFAQAGLTNQFRDAQLLGTYERDAVHAVRAFHAWPLWDPYVCGGVYALGSPQGRMASPPILTWRSTSRWWR